VKIVSSLLLLIGALAVLTLGAFGVSASPAMAETPCHEMGQATPDPSGKAPDKAPDKAMKAMACCVACVAAPTIPPAARPQTAAAPLRLTAVSPALPSGRRPSPEPGPPRLLIA
jgi:hypothetical protein